MVLPLKDVWSYCDKTYHLSLVLQIYDTAKPGKQHLSRMGMNPEDDAR